MVFILLAVGLLIYAYVADVGNPEGELAPQGPGTGQKITGSSGTGQNLQLQSQKSGISVDTFISFGPRNNEIINDTNRLSFEFGVKITPENTEGQISYETKVEGLETSWQQTYSTQRTIDFPAGQKQYTFFARAKIKDTVDPTPAKLTFTLNLSPYFGKVKMSNVRAPDIYANPTLITLNTYLGSSENINITGWKLEAKKGYLLLPQAMGTYNPLITTVQFQDIIVKQNDTIYISSESNPLGGKDWNFRVNKCMGYLDNATKFPIPISVNCPRPQGETLPLYLGTRCKEYIATLGACQQPTDTGMQSYDVFKDSNCLNYVNSTFNYTGCYAKYYQTANFWENQWNIYLNRTDREIMTDCDTIYLRDKNDLLIDKYIYGAPNCRR